MRMRAFWQHAARYESSYTELIQTATDTFYIDDLSRNHIYFINAYYDETFAAEREDGCQDNWESERQQN